MNKLKSILVYFCRKWSSKKRPDAMTKSRLRHMAYLADWKSCLERDRQITDAQWEKMYGPYLRQFDKELRWGFEYHSHQCCVDEITANEKAEYDLTPEEIKVLDFVLETSNRKSRSELLLLVRSTYPMMSSGDKETLDLVWLSKYYKEEVREHL
ncbi:MAG: Panacea domain-containing protein [Bacteroidota bacterium]